MSDSGAKVTPYYCGGGMTDVGSIHAPHQAVGTDKWCVGDPRLVPSAADRARAEATDLQRRIDRALALPVRPWSEDDADSAESRSARAYNHALAQVREALTSAEQP